MLKTKQTNIFFASLALILSIITSAHAGVEIRMESEGTEIRMDIDDNGLMRIIGGPFTSDHYYHLKKGVFIYQHPEEQEVYYIPTVEMMKGQEADLRTPEDTETKKFAGYKSTKWDIEVDDYPCGTVYGSTDLSNIAGVDVTDLARVNLALGHLYALDMNQNKCDFFRFLSASGKLVGFPSYMQTEFGISRIAKVFPNALVDHKLGNPKLMDDKTHLRFLKRLLTPQMAMAFAKINSRQKADETIQLKAIKSLLKNPNNRK